MVRTQIQLTESEYRRLVDAAHRLNRSMADCVREGVSLFLGRAAPLDDLSDIAGKFKPLPAADEQAHDAQWVDAIMASKRGSDQ